MAFQSFQEILEICREQNRAFWEIVAADDLNERGVTMEESMSSMRHLWLTMVESSQSYEKESRSNSGLVGGDGGKMLEYTREQAPLGGDC